MSSLDGLSGRRQRPAATPGGSVEGNWPQPSHGFLAPPAARRFANCTEMHTVYPHGVGMPGAVDSVSGTTKPVTTFERSSALYEANRGSDRDKDSIACEA